MFQAFRCEKWNAKARQDFPLMDEMCEDTGFRRMVTTAATYNISTLQPSNLTTIKKPLTLQADESSREKKIF
jgi:hypothetical protein